MKLLNCLILIITFNVHADWKSKVDTHANKYINATDTTAVSIIIGHKDKILFTKNYGNDINDLSMFDLASLTKVFTATSIMILEEQSRLKISDKVCWYIKQYCNKSKSSITIENLLRHNSGLPSWMELKSVKGDKFKAIFETKLKAKPNTEFIYSDIGYMTLGRIVEIVSNKSLDRFTSENIFTPLKMNQTSYSPTKSNDCVLTTTHENKCIVHDENTQTLNNVAGHAGIFSSTTDLFKFINVFVTDSKFLTKNSKNTMTIKAPTSNRGLGFDIMSPYSKWLKGSFFTDKSFGHSGYTGTSFWIDHSGLSVIILTNRVINGDSSLSKKQIKVFRKLIADTVARQVIPNKSHASI
jgi:CubicO group peptidase (beta-lactamase class C family)